VIAWIARKAHHGLEYWDATGSEWRPSKIGATEYPQVIDAATPLLALVHWGRTNPDLTWIADAAGVTWRVTLSRGAVPSIRLER
jgi:hypothetical protein